MKKMFLIIAMILFGIAARAQTAMVTFSADADNYGKTSGAEGMALMQTGENTFTAVPSPPAPCVPRMLSDVEIDAFQDQANDCCCRTGTCIYDGCGTYYLYVFYPSPLSGCAPDIDYAPVASFNIESN